MNIPKEKTLIIKDVTNVLRSYYDFGLLSSDWEKIVFMKMTKLENSSCIL